MAVKDITTAELRTMKDRGGIIFQGCGGEAQEWIDGINRLLTEENILDDGAKFNDIERFHDGHGTCLLFPFTEDVKLNMGKFAIWRIKTNDSFGGMWLSDYVNIHLGGFVEQVTLDRGTLTLTESGTYEVSIVANGITQSFTVTVDATAPTLTVNGVDEEGRAKKSVILTDVSEEADVKVFLNDTEIEYTIGDELTEEGTYKVVVTDDCGNSTEYSFEIKHGLNGGIIALIVIVSLLAVGGVVVFILKKKEII